MFQPGRSVRLADGQEWFLPGPPSGSFPRSWYGQAYDDLLQALEEAEDLGEYRRTELALTIHLLGLNYVLSADDLQVILWLRSDDQALAASQTVLHEIIREHLEASTSPERTARNVSEFTAFQRVIGRLLHWSRAE